MLKPFSAKLAQFSAWKQGQTEAKKKEQKANRKRNQALCYTIHALIGDDCIERSQTRARIRTLGIRPVFQPGTDEIVWDGQTIVDKSGRTRRIRNKALHNALRQQIQRMLAEGFWPDLDPLRVRGL